MATLEIFGVDYKKFLKEFFRTEEKRSNHEEERKKIEKEIAKLKAKEAQPANHEWELDKIRKELSKLNRLPGRGEKK